jgi:DNA-binding transcriptional LysR family regulator
VERREIEIFLALADELHFGRTAERLHVSTARVSQTITGLERRFGARLFERTSRRVTLTPVGSRLRDDLRPAVEQIEAGIARATATGRASRASCGSGSSAPPPAVSCSRWPRPSSTGTRAVTCRSRRTN